MLLRTGDVSQGLSLQSGSARPQMANMGSPLDGGVGGVSDYKTVGMTVNHSG